jgi:carboxymethylenebutenolidase
MRGDRLCHEHISWDQATALKQLDLLPEFVPFRGVIDGREAGEGKRFEVRLPVVGKEGAAKLVDEGCGESNTLMGKSWREVDDV